MTKPLKYGFIGGASAIAFVFGGVALTINSTNHPSAAQAHASRSSDVDAGRLPVVSSEGLDALPSDTLQDWVTYADSVVVATATRIRRGEVSQEEKESGEGLQVRYVTLAIERVLWSRAGSADAPSSLEVPLGGWLTNQSGDRRLAIPNSVRLLEGHRYVLPVARGVLTRDQWEGFPSQSYLPFDGEIAGTGEEIIDVSGRPIDPAEDPIATRRALWGKSAEQIAEALNMTRPDERAKEFASLAPVDRWLAVSKVETESPG